MLNIEFYMDEDKHKGANRVIEDGTTGSLFAEAAEEYMEITKNFETTCAKIEAYTEATDRELAINIAKCELKCWNENGTSDDLCFLEEAAEEGAVGKLKKLIDAAIAAFKEWVSSVKTRIIKSIASAQARETLKKAEKKIKLNPFISKKKVEMVDTTKAYGIIKTYKSKVDKMSGKIVVKGILSENEMKTLNDTKEEFRKSFKSSIAGSAGVKMVTVAALLVQINSDLDRLPAIADDIEATHTSVLNKLKASVTAEAAASAQAATNACVNFRNELAREELNLRVDALMDNMKTLKDAVNKAKGNEQVKIVKESVDDMDYSDLLSEFSESADESMDDMDDFDKLFNDIGI